MKTVETMTGFFVQDAPLNEGPTKAMWAFLASDEEGGEAVTGSVMGPLGVQPLVTSSPRNLELFKPFAREIREQLRGSGRTVKLVRFERGEEEEF